MKVNGCDFFDDFEEAVGFVKFFDFLFELEFFEDGAGAGGESGDEIAQVGGELIVIAEKFLEGELAGVVEGQLELPVDHFLDRLSVVFVLSFKLLVHGNHLILGLLQDAVEAAQNGERDHHPTILRRSVGAAKEVSDVPDDITFFFECFELTHVAREIESISWLDEESMRQRDPLLDFVQICLVLACCFFSNYHSFITLL